MVKQRRRNHAIKKLPPGRARGAEGHTVTAIGRATRQSSSQEIEPNLDSELDGYIKLWRAVFAQAIMDAKSRRTKRGYDFIRHSAISWLLENQRDFKTVCEFAGIEPDYLRRCVREAQKGGFILPGAPKPQQTKHERESRRTDLLEQSVARGKQGRQRQGFVTRFVQLELF